MQDLEHQHHTHHYDDDGSPRATLTEAGTASPAHHAQFSRRRARPADHLSWRSMYGMSASTRSFRRANALRFVHQPDVDPAAAWPATLNQPSFTTSLKDNP